ADSATAQEARVREQLEAWAKAWSPQDMKAYLAAYARDFQTPGGMSRSQWEADRQLKITSKKRIRVEVSQLQIRWREQEATVQFRQAYESDNLKVVSRKTLIWVLRDGQWRILRETTG
ncbi:MAG: YybH family protein, partial [Limnohabitans sp.]